MPHDTESLHGHHEQSQLDRIERSVGRTEASTGRNEGRIMEMLARLEGIERTMADLSTQLDEVKANLDAATTKLGTDLDILIAAFKAAPGTLTPEQQAKLDLIAGVATTLKDMDDKTVAAVSVEPPVDPNAPPVLTARRRI